MSTEKGDRMRELPPEERRPTLKPKVRIRFDEREQQWMLLAPERGLLLNDSAKRIVDLCDGTRTEGAIAKTLADASSAPLDVVVRDVAAVLEELRERVLLEPGT